MEGRAPSRPNMVPITNRTTRRSSLQIGMRIEGGATASCLQVPVTRIGLCTAAKSLAECGLRRSPNAVIFTDNGTR